MSHDQNFKNLILDYPREALALFAAPEAADLTAEVRITPVRQEQLQERLGERFHELDIPLQVEWPDGRRAALLFLIEEETEARRFSIHRLIRYCADLAELLKTDRVVPVVIFLRGEPHRRFIALGGERHTYLSFTYIACELAVIPALGHRDSDNIVARLTLPNMRYEPAERVAVYHAAVSGLMSLEPNPDKQKKYLDFIDIYTALDENERAQYAREYPEEVKAMSRFADRFREEGLQQGVQQGLQQGVQQGLEQGLRRGLEQGVQRGLQKGEAAVLLRQLHRKFGELPDAVRQRVETADPETLLTWSERILTAQSIDEVVH
jgi:hypothetical protein